MNFKWCVLSFWCLISLVCCNHQLPKEIELAYNNLPQKIDFNFDVKPILSDKCFACHGPDRKSLKADLRLDLPGEALKRSKESGEIPIVPGKSLKSHLVERILSEDPEVMMPPPESHLALNHQEIATLIKWIDQGAEFKEHWSFIKPEKSELPLVLNSSWPRNPLDLFVLKKLEDHGYSPSSGAEKEILVRRLHFNLTGLPPSLEEMEAFTDDHSPDAYENLVDKLLASSAYGERMTMEWMDVARYADSDGYLDDKHRDFSPWRDWVIASFNENMPYDQFVTWQLAGDLIPEATQSSILATAFNRLHKKNSEAGIVFEEYRTEYVADRTNTMSKAFLGLSVECARCHDHKYDPVSQKDYYKIFAFFNSTNEIGTPVYGPDQTPGPALLLTDEEQQRILEYTASKIDNQEHQLTKITSDPDQKYHRWLTDKDKIISSLPANQRKGLVGYFPFEQFTSEKSAGVYTTPNEAGNTPAIVKEPLFKPGAKANGVFLDTYTQITLPQKLGWFERTDPFSVSFSVFPDTLYPEVGIFYHCENYRLGLKGYSLYLDNNHLRFVIAHSWPQNAIQVRTKSPIEVDQWSQVSITYDGSSKAKGVNIYINGEAVPITVDYDHLYKGILFKPDIHTYGFAGFTLGERDKMKTFKFGGIDELKIYDRELAALEVIYGYNPERASEIVKDGNAKLVDPLLHQYYHHHYNNSAASMRKNLQAERTSLNNHINNISEIMVMGDLPQPRQTFVLERGSYDAHGQQVEAGVPDGVFPFDADLPPNRLGLATWLFDKDHPLTARVLVNRIWQMHFGKGIVRTSDDFGSQGDIPTHPELLDWLAVECMESGWDIKELHKTIVMSATFQQSSKETTQMLKEDPHNDLLSRGPSFRLKAEMIRDNALAISGLLVNKLGGASVYPYQPTGLWDEISNKKWRYKYLQEPGEGLYRRSLYTVWKRTSPPPSMLVFDAGDRTVCQVGRNITSTPLQALVLLNDPQYLEAARVLAEQVLVRDEGDHMIQLKTAFGMAIGRSPDLREIELLDSFYEEEFDRFSIQEHEALAYISIGEQPYIESLDPARVAALATVINGILNTTESYTLR